MLFSLLIVLIHTSPVCAISDSARRVETTFFFIAASQPLDEEVRLECPDTIRHSSISTYTGINPDNASAPVDGILWKDLTVNGIVCLTSSAPEASTFFEDRLPSPPGTVAAQAEPYFLVGADNAARRCGPFSAKSPARYYFTDDLPRFKQRFIQQGFLPSTSELPEAIANPIRGDVYMFSRQFSSESSQVQSSITCTYLAATPESTPEPTSLLEDDDGSVCFPASATVKDEDNNVIQMQNLRLGDRIQVSAYGMISPVISFSHRDRNIRSSMTTLVISGTSRASRSNSTIISASSSHLLRLPDGSMRSAGAFVRGDRVLLSGGHIGYVERVASKVAQGLYSPITAHGDIIVDGVVATCYTTSLSAQVAHALLAPARAIFFTATRVSLAGPDWCGIIDVLRTALFR